MALGEAAGCAAALAMQAKGEVGTLDGVKVRETLSRNRMRGRSAMLEMRTFFTLILSLTTALAAEEADVVVVSATPAGVAAAVAAARSGAKVVVLEESAHVGGIIAVD